MEVPDTLMFDREYDVYDKEYAEYGQEWNTNKNLANIHIPFICIRMMYVAWSIFT